MSVEAEMETSSQVNGFISEEELRGRKVQIVAVAGTFIGGIAGSFWLLIRRTQFEMKNRKRGLLWRVQDKLLQKDSDVRVVTKDGNT